VFVVTAHVYPFLESKHMSTSSSQAMNTDRKSGPKVAREASFEGQLRSALSAANIPTLLLLTVQLSGDRKWLEEPYKPRRSKGIDDNDTGGLEPEIQAEIRLGAFEAIMAHRAGRPVALPSPSAEQMAEMMGVSEEGTIPPDYADVMIARLKAYTDPESVVPQLQLPQGFRALIVGAGMSGICAAIRFKQAGIPYDIVEKQSDSSGVWCSHTYPGVAVDTPGHLYSYTFAGGDWSRYFPAGAEIESYFRGVAKQWGIYDQVQFGVEVLSAEFDEKMHCWKVVMRNPDGTVTTKRPAVLIAGVGIFNEPIIPDLPGLKDFKGPVVHTARWEKSLDLTRKKVAFFGTGASAMQVVPAIAPEVEKLTIFQRTRQWAVPFPKFKQPVPDDIRWLMREVPQYLYWYRLRLSWIFDSKVYPSFKKDPGWNDEGRSINAINAGHRRYLTRYIESELGERKDLLDKVIPAHPPYVKRMLLDNGWFKTIQRDNVELVDSSDDVAVSVDATGVVTRHGRHIDADVILLATGYKVARMLSTLDLKGRGGTSIRDVWGSDEPRAYLGTVIPKFPNLFVLYGPNTQLGHGGAFIFVMECQISYVIDAIKKMSENNLDEIECRQDVHDAYNDRVQQKHKELIWTHEGVTTYVRNSQGKVVGNNPWSLVEFWSMLRQANLGDFVTHTRADTSVELTA
jgi:4-hydroxyacetophenone monooxygenase